MRETECFTLCGGDTDSLPRWFPEVEVAIVARQRGQENIKVSFAMSKLVGKAKAWASGKLMSNSLAFPTYEIIKADLTATFQPPQCEFRMCQRFLTISLGRRDLHSYAQEIRYLIANIVESPVDEATQVSVFLSRLNQGVVRTQMFSKYPDSLDAAISEALQEASERVRLYRPNEIWD